MKTYEELVQELAEIELSEGSHSTLLEDYEDPQEFYLENVVTDSYLGFLEGYLTDAEQQEYNIAEIQDSVIDYIQEK